MKSPNRIPTKIQFLGLAFAGLCLLGLFTACSEEPGIIGSAVNQNPVNNDLDDAQDAKQVWVVADSDASDSETSAAPTTAEELLAGIDAKR